MLQDGLMEIGQGWDDQRVKYKGGIKIEGPEMVDKCGDERSLQTLRYHQK